MVLAAGQPGQPQDKDGDGSLQLDQASWETLRGLVKIEVASQVHLWSDTLEKTKAQVDHRLEDFHGKVGIIDKEHCTTVKNLNDRQAHSESKIANLTVDLHKCGATGRGELRRACIELDSKITALGERDDSEKRELDNKIDREAEALRQHHLATATDMYAKLQDLQQQVINDRAERQATQTRCMHYTDRQVAAAMASKELEARFQAVRDSVTALRQELHETAQRVREDLTKHTEERCAALHARCDSMVEQADRRHAEMCTRMDKCNETAAAAAASADEAVHLVDESLQQKVLTASNDIRMQLEAAAARSESAGHSDEHAKEQAKRRTSKRAQELQAGFYALVAREALDTEIRALVDRATRRLQVVADDVSQRSVALQDHVVAAEERLEDRVVTAEERCRLALEFAQKPKLQSAVARARAAGPPTTESVGGAGSKITLDDEGVLRHIDDLFEHWISALREGSG